MSSGYEFTTALRGEHGRKYGATHGLKLLFVFKSFAAFEDTFEEHALADWMQDRWGECAATGSLERAGVHERRLHLHARVRA